MGYVDCSEVNGPGCRAVVWVQGCARECPGCFNPDSWPFEINQLIAVDTLAKNILSNPRNTGVTFSGGEPFWQAPALAALARQVNYAQQTEIIPNQLGKPTATLTLCWVFQCFMAVHFVVF